MSKPPEDICLENVETARKVQSPVRISAMGYSRCHVVCHRFFICLLLVAVLRLSSVIAIHRNASSTPNVCQSKECFRSAAGFKQTMDLSVDPCEDFYSYVCSHWAEDHPRPKRHLLYSQSIERQIKVDDTIRNRLETSVIQSDPKPVAQAKHMYRACLRSAGKAAASQGFEAIKTYLAAFELPAVPRLLNRENASGENYEFDWISSVAKIQRKLGLDVMIGMFVGVDQLNRERWRLTLGYSSEPELRAFPWHVWSALQQKDHASRASNEEPQKSDIKYNATDNEQNEETYPEELAKTLHKLITLINPTVNTSYPNSTFLTLAEKFLSFHKQLPVVSEDEPEDKQIAFYTVSELQNITDSRITLRKPYPVWQHYLDVLFADLPDIKPAADEKLQIRTSDVEYLGNIIDFLSKQSPELIELYVWKTVTEFLVDHPFNKLDTDTERDCIKYLNKLMGLAVTYLIADRNFLIKTKPRVEQMFNDIRSEFNQMVLEADWMDANTKDASIEKSMAMKALIGFPEWILDVDKLEEHYRGLEVNEFRHFENWVNALQHVCRENLQLLNLTIRDIWPENPAEVNAFNARTINKLGIHVALIQYPFYYLGLEALNYGALGHTVGHEVIHGFGETGRHHDKFGNREQWWPNHTHEEFDKRASCLIDQYDSYFVPEANGFINGTFTLEENIADNGGLREAFRAYQSYVKKNGPEPLLLGFENFTHEQLFFISFASRYCATLSPLFGRMILDTSVHSPPKFRVLGVLSNMEEFSEAFQCPRGSKMNPEKKCRVW